MESLFIKDAQMEGKYATLAENTNALEENQENVI